MPPAKFSSWKKDKGLINQQSIPCIPCVILAVTVGVLFVFFLKAVMPLSICHSEKRSLPTFISLGQSPSFDGGSMGNLEKFNCMTGPQAAPVVANKVEGVQYPFFISLADLGSPEKPNRNFLRLLKGKLFRKPDISQTIQEVLQKLKSNGLAERKGLVVDVGANVGMAAFAAAAMGYRVVAFEAVFENLQRLCDGMYLNRASDIVSLYHAAVSDMPGNLTMHKVLGRLDNSAVSATGAKLAFKSNELVPVNVTSVTLDTVIPKSERILLIKIDVQGWEYHVLKGATHILSRELGEAPYIIYEDDEKLLRESNTRSKDIRDFLVSVGYNSFTRLGTDTHCKKERTK